MAKRKKTSTNPTQASCVEGGTVQHDDEAVEVRTGATYSRIPTPVASPALACKAASKTVSADDAIAIKVKCKKNPHVVQFIYREIIGADGKHVAVSARSAAGTYDATTDPSKPNWNTDSAAKPNPYYEGVGIHRKDPDALTIVDQPSVRPGPGETWRATFKAYTICDGKVTREVTWVREQKHGSPPTYTATVAKASALPQWAQDQMKAQGYRAVP